MKIELRGGLLYVPVHLEYGDQVLQLDDVILDTGSAGSIFSADALLNIELVPEPHDRIRRIRGVGGVEFVFTKRLDLVAVDDLHARDFEVEVGALDYGFAIEGILGADFLLQVGAVIDLNARELRLG